MKNLPSSLAPAAVAAALVLGPVAPTALGETNIINWLSGNGIAIVDCVSGSGYHDTYNAAKLFDGKKEVSNESEARANRCLMDESKGSFTGYVTIAAPASLFASPQAGLSLVRYRIWHYSSLSDNLHLNRAPSMWLMCGSNDGENWEVIDERTTAFAWTEDTAYAEVVVPETARSTYRMFKFLPTASHASSTNPNGIGYTWQIGAMELELFVEPIANETTRNLRDIITSAGVETPSCVTGSGAHNDYPASKLFDGLGKGVADTTLRWLAGEKSLEGVHATIVIPDAATDGGKTDYILKGYRLWRNINGGDGINRAPTTWVIFGSNDGENWTEIHRQSSAVSWAANRLSCSVSLPSNTAIWRYLRFVPLSSNYDLALYNWGVGLQEIEYFVEPVTFVNLRERMVEAGVTVADYVSGTGAHANYPATHLFDGLGKDGLQNLPIRWIAGENSLDGVSATLQFPRSACPEGVAGYAVRKIRLWRIVREYNDADGTGVLRAPRTWVFEGSDNGTEWTIIQQQNDAITWRKGENIYCDIYLPLNETNYRQLRFRPLSNDYPFSPNTTWGVGLHELEYFGVPNPSEECPFVIVVR